MANSYTQIYVQYVFAVKGRRCFIQHQHRENLQKYITGLVKKRNTGMIAINCMPDHIHLFVKLHPTYSVSKFIQEIKANSSKFVNDNKWYENKFRWQSGYGAFSYSQFHIDLVINYIMNQEMHHRKKLLEKNILNF